jgi:Phosphodiester glycosidase
MTLTLLIFGGQSDANMFDNPLVNPRAASSQQVFGTPNSGADTDATLRRLRYLAGLRYFNSSTKKPRPSTLNNAFPQVARGVTLVTEVLQTVAGPEQISMLNIDLTNSDVRLGIVQAYNRLINPAKTLSAMADQAGAVAGINGDFFDIHTTNVPIGEEVINGHLLHSPNPHDYAVLGVTSSGQVTIGHEDFSGSVIDGSASYRLFSVNHYSEINNGRLVLFTPDLGEPDFIGGDPVAIIQPVADSSSSFIVRSVYSGTAWLPALSGLDALVASGDAAYWLTNTLHPGDHIKLIEHIAPDPDLFQAIGGGPQVVMDGAYYFDPYQPAPGEDFIRNPQTAVGVTKDGTHMILAIFDGRYSGPRRSRGMTHAEVASFMIAQGCYNAMLFDSGGSSEMVARLPGDHSVSVINWPSGGHERPVANGLFIYSNDHAHAMAALRHGAVR